MKAYWQKYVAAFDARGQRERAILAAAIVIGLIALAYQSGFHPLLARGQAAEMRMAQAERELSEVRGLIQSLERGQDPDADNRRALEAGRQQLAGLDARFLKIEQSLVPARQMPDFLRSILVRNHKLTLISLDTMPPVPAIGPRSAGGNGETGQKTAGRPDDDGQIKLFKHGIELKVAGSYPDLLAYVADLEKESGKLLWDRMELAVDKYPRSVLTLTLYTLGLSKDWLAL